MAFTPKLLQQGAGGGGPKNYIEDVFKTYVYDGNGTSQTITNGIDLSGKGGLIWTKKRNGGTSHFLIDTIKGITSGLISNSDVAAANWSTEEVTGFTSTGYTLGTSYNNGYTNYSGGNTYASWTFRKQPKFFDIVTWTGNGVSGRTISHNLGSAPGCIIVKRTDDVAPWAVYHRSLTYTDVTPTTFPAEQCWLSLNTTNSVTNSSMWGNTSPTSSVFSVGGGNYTNTSGGTYIAYLFAHDAGGFGLTGTDNVISCGTFDATSAGSVTLGYEPQWVLIKASSDVGSWHLHDNMRGYATSGNNPTLDPDRSVSEFTGGYTNPTATGFTHGSLGSSFIYIAIRRGPMKVPTTGTDVFSPVARTGTGADATVSSGFPTDSALTYNRGGTNPIIASRLTSTGYLATPSTAAEVVGGATVYQANPWDVMSGIKLGTTSALTNQSGNTFINYMFRRAPGFFDEVCYTGTGAIRTISHNLTVAPEWMIVKKRSASASWYVYVASLGAGKEMILDLTLANQFDGADLWNSTNPTSSVFTLGADATVNQSAATYVAYLFATCAGVSKCGSYTGTGAAQTINCGFTAGARFVLIKRTDDSGDWYVWDSARGIIAGNDPYFLLNSAAAEVTNTDYIDSYSPGFELSSTAPAAINASGGTFIFLAIA
jgi:hypothetical protein